jgi:hypothetical protein
MSLDVDAIRPLRRRLLTFGLNAVGRWELTCGRCRTAFTSEVWDSAWSSAGSRAVCPRCRARNVLPMPLRRKPDPPGLA